MLRLDRAFLLILLVGGCTDDSDPPSGGGTSDDDDEGEESTTSTTDGKTTTGTTAVDTDTTAGTTAVDTDATMGTGSTGEPECDPVGRPEVTGPIVGLQASYLAGDEMEIGVPVDEETVRVIVGIYEVGSDLYLGGTAEDFAGPTTAQLSFFAGVVDGEVGTFYIAVELCSTSTCTSPFVRNTYQRQDRLAPFADGETYEATREFVGQPAMTEMCPTDIPIQTFLIE